MGKISVLILDTGHSALLKPVGEGLRQRGYAIGWDQVKSSKQMDKADITWLSALSLDGKRTEQISDFARTASAKGRRLVSYYVGDWTNLAVGRKALRGIDWTGFSSCFQANPALVAELQQLCPTARGLRFVYLPRAINQAYKYEGRRGFRRRIGLWGQYGRWWKDAWWLIRAFGKLQDMTDEHWELEFRGCRPRFIQQIPPMATQEAKELGVKLLPWGSLEDLVDWVYTLDIVANASLSEGDAKPIAEGMLTGCYPLVRNWPGARDLYPDEYIVENEWAFVQKAIAWAERPDDEKRQLAGEAEAFARRKHDLDAIVDTVDSEFRYLMGEADAK